MQLQIGISSKLPVIFWKIAALSWTVSVQLILHLSGNDVSLLQIIIFPGDSSRLLKSFQFFLQCTCGLPFNRILDIMINLPIMKITNVKRTLTLHPSVWQWAIDNNPRSGSWTLFHPVKLFRCCLVLGSISSRTGVKNCNVSCPLLFTNPFFWWDLVLMNLWLSFSWLFYQTK